jgi:hypothetical protein
MKAIDLWKTATPEGVYLRVDMEDLVKQPWFRVWADYNFGATSWPKWMKAFPITEMDACLRLVDKNRLNLVFKQPIWSNQVSYISLVTTNGSYCEQMYMNPKNPQIHAKVIQPDFSWKLKSKAHSIYTSGWDPEIFVVDEKQQLIPAFSFLPPKSKPLKTGSDHCYGQGHPGDVYYDGFQAEFTTHAGSCHGYGIDYIRGGMMKVLQAARVNTPKAKLSIKNVFHVPQRFLLEATDDQVGLGCKPSLNVYGRDSFMTPDPRMLPIRVAGGHIHFGFADPPSMKKEIPGRIKAMDRILGLMTVAMFDEIDDPVRREFYGRAGEYRETRYGLEYRVLSNAWMGTPEVAHLVMEMARQANLIHKFTDEEIGWKLNDESVQEIINYCDVKSARKLIKKNWSVWETLLYQRFHANPGALKAAEELIFGGVHAGFPEFENLETNWMLTNSSWMRHSDNSRKTWGTHGKAEKYTSCTSKISPSVPSALTVGR